MIKRKDGRWQQSLTIEENGVKKTKYFYGKTKAEVLRKIAEYKDKVDSAPSGAMFEAVADAWWTQHEPTLSPTTVSGYNRGYKRAREYFQGKYISALKPLDLIRFMDHCIEKWKMSQKSAANQLIVIKGIFRFAIMRGDIDVNPAREVSIPRGLPKEKRRSPDSEDIQRIKDSVSCSFGLLPYMALYTGLRKGELLALTWEDIDREKRTIRVTKSVYNQNNRPHIKEPKTENGIRPVPLPNKLLEVLPTNKSGIVFPDKDGGYMTEKHFRTAWTKYQEESGVTCTLHQLRHAYATMLFENDIGVKDAQRVLGHAQSSTTNDIYTDIRKAREEKINSKLLSIDIV